MIEPRATSVPRTLNTYSWESRSISSWMRTGGITMPSSPAIWRRIIDTRRTSDPPVRRSTRGTSPKPMPSSSGSIGSSFMTSSRGEAGASGGGGGGGRVGRRGGGQRRGGGGGELLRHAVANRPADRRHQAADEQERQLGEP